MDRFNSKDDQDYPEYCERVCAFLPPMEGYDSRAFMEFLDDVFDAYYVRGVDERVAAEIIVKTFGVCQKRKFEELHAHQVRMRERYKSALNWFEEKYPQGLGYLHPEHGGYIGINVITKQFIKEFLEQYERGSE